MSAGPVGMSAIASRISALSQAPAAVTAIQSRFASLVETASSLDAATTDATAVTTSSGAATAGSSTASRSAVATTGVSTTGVATTLPSTTAASLAPTTTVSSTIPTTTTVPITGTWAQRVPNERGQALVPAIAETAQRYGLDPAFLAAVFWTESSYTPDVVSPTGAIGLGQLMPGTAATLGVDPWDPMENMDGAARLYRYYLDKYDGNVELSISAYAAGAGAVAQAGGIPDDFTANYIVKLLGRRDYLNGLRNDAP